MHINWSASTLLAAEFTFAVLFVQALLGYLRRRDPLQRDVTLVFAPCTVLFCIDVARRLHDGTLPGWMNTAALAFLAMQPFLTVRLAGRLRAVPGFLHYCVLALSTSGAVSLILTDENRPFGWLVFAVGGFLAGELVAAALLLGKARTRSGANRARLIIAAGATMVFGLMIVLMGLGGLPGAINRLLALVSGLGYLFAFAPPRWLRRAFAASAAQSVTERLLRARVRTADELWQTYAEMMRQETGADAVAVLMPRGDGLLAPTAYAGPAVRALEDVEFADLTALIRAGRPARLREGDPALVQHFGDDLGDDFVTVLSMPVPPEAEGAVLLFNRHRSLFSDDDLRLLALLGGQAGVLAERQAVLAAQHRMAAELSESVEALTRAGQAKSAFLANMSHELRTPLNAIIGFSDLMRLEEPDGDRRRVPADWVEHIHTSGRHLLGLINDILDLAKVEAGRLELRLAPLRADTAVEELLTGLAPLITSNGLTVVRELEPATASADRVRFRQIVENLLSNAIKFTPPDGRITVTTADRGDHVTVTVADTGVGIAEADHERVFEEFQQVGDPDRQRAGTGLGLALTRRLVEAHDGEISLVSVPGEGSAFTVRLPAAPVVSPVGPDEPGDRARVLLIEDDPQAAELLRTQLEHAGYHVDVAGTGEAGLTAAGARPPDAIVLDVALPGIDGFEVIRQLKADARLAGIPVFFATIIDERQAGLALGADDYFVKPVDQAALLGALARTLADRHAPRVLVVDHDDAVRRSIEDGLRAGGADVVAVADGRDGLTLSREGDFDLIVCDLQARDGDGFSMLAAMEQDPATRHTPVLGLTQANGDASLVATAMAGGVMAAAMTGGAGAEKLAPLLGVRTDMDRETP
ncbi:response regulator [Pseudosporangium ferrugineum]|uniref:histidine kinase n=1 Tax=Pseudosporangium ferrugineum TaxID=439699 RepID=A0A2T0RE04_9ACTN|nr:response regulator [Pseudosporangium ferrugineum]PRY19383.1 signal transduction histidine kinase [Pseudosporangium ferrugineum]